MWGAAGQPEFLAAFSQLPRRCFHPTHLCANQEVAVRVGEEAAGVPTECLTLLLPCGSPGTPQCPQPQGQPGPATLLPGTKRGIEGHSGALSSPCLPGRGRLPSAGFSSLVLALQHPWELWYPRDMGHPRELALEPYPPLGDPTAAPTRAPFPYEGQGAGESGHRITSVREKSPSLEHLGLKACPWDEGPHWQVLGGLGR